MSKPPVENYFCQLADDVRLFGSKMCYSVGNHGIYYPKGYSLTGSPLRALRGFPVHPTVPAPPKILEQAIDMLIEKLKKYQSFGYEMANLYLQGVWRPESLFMFYPNRRTDQFGGSFENEVRFAQMIGRRVKQELGQDFLIEEVIRFEYQNIYTLEDLAQFLKAMEGLIDIVVLRDHSIASEAPCSYVFREGEHNVIEAAKKLRAMGVKQVISLNGGFQNPDEMEALLQEGVCDMFALVRAYYTDPEYLRKIREGRPEDIRPCTWCNRCHGNLKAPWLNLCTVNPFMGQESKLPRLVEQTKGGKKVAVIGGGPAGLESALDCAQRGHHVTLFEQENYLGGQLRHTDDYAFKWGLKKFRDWLIAQCEKHGVEFRMNTKAEPEMIRSEGFDAVIACTGSRANLPDSIAGIFDDQGERVPGIMTVIESLGHDDQVGQRVIVVGASETGTECAIHYAQLGREVILLTRQDEICHDLSALHSLSMSWEDFSVGSTQGAFSGVRPEWTKYPNLKTHIRCTTKQVRTGGITYEDENGTCHDLDCDTVIICGGMRPNIDESLAFVGSARDFFRAGDCIRVGTVRDCVRTAFGAAQQV